MTKIKKKNRIKKKINCFIEAKGRKEREEGKGERKKSRPSFSGGEEIKKKKKTNVCFVCFECRAIVFLSFACLLLFFLFFSLSFFRFFGQR